METGAPIENIADVGTRTEQALRTSELSYRRLFEAAQDGILILDAETGRVNDVNPFLTKLLGFSHAEMVGKTVGELSPFKDIVSNRKILQQLQQDGYIRYEDVPLETRDGRKMAVEFVSNVYLVGDQKVIQCNIRDVTEHKRSEKELRESRRFLQSTLDALSAHIAILDEQGKIIAVNAAWNRFADQNHFMGSECGVGANYLQVCESAAGKFAGEVPRAMSGIRAVIAGSSELFTLEYPCHSPKEKRWFLLGVTRFDGDGPVRAVVSHENITERKKMEARFRRLVDSNAQGVIFWNMKGQITEANDAFLNLMGYSRADLAGGPIDWVAMTPPKYAKADQRAMKELAATGTCKPYEKEYVRKDGSRVPILIGAATFEDSAEEGVCFVLDLTERKKLEQQYRQAQKMESIGTLAGGVAHDFNNILAVIQMQSDLLRYEGPLLPPQLEAAEGIAAATQRGAGLTRQLLLFSRKESLQLRDLDLNQSINNITSMLRRVLGEDVQMQFRFATQPLVIHADASMMDQVLMNLAVNSRDAMPRGGLLVIETSAVEFDETVRAQSAQARAGSFVCLSVSDNGCGIPAENLSRIFEPFFTTKEAGKGTGLGLATLFGIVQQHHGWVNVYSEVGQGTTFRIYLPRLSSVAALESRQPLLPALCSGDETILLVEDDNFLRPSLCKLLTELGYRVLVAKNGAEALDLWKQHRERIDLLLADLILPGGMNGKELSTQLLRENPKLKVIHASGYSADIVGKDFPLKEGLNFLTKPFQAQKLAETVRRTLDGKA